MFEPINCIGVLPAPETVKKSGFVGQVRAALGSNQPGAWASDHRTESEKFTGVDYIAIRAICLQAAQATVCVYDDSQDQTGGTAFKMRRASLRKSFGSVFKAGVAAANEPAATPLPATHPLVKLYQRPSPLQSGALFRYEQVMQLCLTGTCIIAKIPSQLRRTVERYVIPTGVAVPRQPSRDLPRGGFYVNPSAVRSWASMADPEGYVEMSGFSRLVGTVIPAEWCMIVRWPHPLVKDDGQSPVSAGALWTDSADMVDRARWAQLKNGANPSLAVTGPEDSDLPQEELTRAAVSFNQKYAGTDNTGKAAFFNHGTVVEPLSTSPKDMVYDLAFTQLRDAKLAIHGVPGLAAGITQATGHEGLYAPLLQFIMLTVQPMLSIMAEEETIQQAPEFGKNLAVEIEAASIDDPEILESSLVTDATVGARTINEHRAVRGLAPVRWGEQRATDGGSDRLPVSQGTIGQGNSPVVDDDGLNGAQITAAVDVLMQVSQGTLAEMPAIELLASVGIARQRAAAMVQANSRLPGQGGSGGDQMASEGGGEFGQLGRRQWQNNRKAIRDVVEDFAAGNISEARAMAELTSLGLKNDRAQALLNDAKDGEIDDADNKDFAAAESNSDFPSNGKSHRLNGHSRGDEDWLAKAVARAWRR